jgi:hypothetical protein
MAGVYRGHGERSELQPAPLWNRLSPFAHDRPAQPVTVGPSGHRCETDPRARSVVDHSSDPHMLPMRRAPAVAKLEDDFVRKARDEEEHTTLRASFVGEPAGAKTTDALHLLRGVWRRPLQQRQELPELRRAGKTHLHPQPGAPR